jgi:hypothetical protein
MYSQRHDAVLLANLVAGLRCSSAPVIVPSGLLRG